MDDCDSPTDSAPRHLRVLQTGAQPLGPRLASHTVPGELWHRHGHDAIVCLACAHACKLKEGQTGLCGVRSQADGDLRVPWGYVARRHVRAVETNTVFHVRPGARALTFGMYGCDLRCGYCHNWKISQALREGRDQEQPTVISPRDLLAEARAQGADVICAAYNEPMIAAEWVRAIFAEAKAAGLSTAVISDGNTTPQALAYLRPVTDVYRVDLKGSTPEQYRAVGGRLEPVMAGIVEARRLGYWVEVVTLVVPGLNDDLRELRRTADRLKDIDPDLPWHLHGFLPNYKMANTPATSPGFLIAAAGAAYVRGLRFVYVGNVGTSGAGAELSHTRCPECHLVLVERRDYQAIAIHLDAQGRCPDCHTPVPGRWR